MQVEKIKVEMLGGFSVWVNGEPIVKNAAKLTKPWQLFCYLALHREKFVPGRKLISVLWEDDQLADPANVLKNAVYSLRKELCGGESTAETPIAYSGGGYRFDTAVLLEMDVEGFDEAYEKAKAALRTAPEESRLALCKDVVDAYRGDFLPQLNQELWVVPLALEYKRKYMDCVDDYCELLHKNKMYKDMLRVASVANLVDPVDEKVAIHLFRALEMLRMYRVIVTTYSRTLQHFEDILGSQPPTEVRRIYNAACERINKTEQDIIVIKTELVGSDNDRRPTRGAYYCTYNNMKHMYQLLRRQAERSKQVLVLALFTLALAKDFGATSHDLTRAMAEFKVVAMNSLRKTDTISRYSRNQYVMLLTVNSLEDGRVVRDRIRERFSGTTISRKVNLDVKMTEL